MAIESENFEEYINIQKIADRMEMHANELRALSNGNQEQIIPKQSLIVLAAKIYSARRRADEIFAMEGFSVSPAWDIMLDLYQAKVSGNQISVTSACIGGACAPTTGLRWLQVLEDMHLITRIPNSGDRQRTVIEITKGGLIKVEVAIVSHL